MKSFRAFAAVVFLCVFTFGLSPAAAHPMGNFSISRHAAILAERDVIRLRYRVDIAEIPAVQEMQILDGNGDKAISAEEKSAYTLRKSAELLANIQLAVDGVRREATDVRCDVIVRPGAGELPTVLLTMDCAFPLESVAVSPSIDYEDRNFSGRAGWQEVVVTFSDGLKATQSTVPRDDQSHGLMSYPADPLAAPPQVTSAHFSFELGRPPAAGKMTAEVPALDSPVPMSDGKSRADSLTELIGRKNISPALLLMAIGLAFVLGCGHALAPGHGKTVVAAYLIGSRATPLHACALGAVVTITHTLGVFALGIIVLFASHYILPERLYPWLGFISGMTIVSIGGCQLIRRLSASYDPSGVAAGHVHGPDGHSHDLPDRITARSLIALGISGGMVPCPSALVVLLGSIALHQTLMGIGLVAAFSLGLATVLTAIGLLMLYARRAIQSFRVNSRYWVYLPVASSIAISLVGAAIAIQSLISGGILGGKGQ